MQICPSISNHANCNNQIERLQKQGIHRIGTPAQGFRYQGRAGRRVFRELEAHIRSLAIPPARKDVVIAPSPRAKLQALGKDKAGRWQYRYSPQFTERQGTAKYERLVEFAQALPKLLRSIAQNIATPGLGHDRVMACMLRILSTCFIRAGSQPYADEHGSYGIASLLKRHVSVGGDLVTFDYRGKSGQQQHREVRDLRVATVVRALLKSAPGRSLFQYQLEDGSWVDVRRSHVNASIKEVMGQQFSAKDFRTWAGTLLCACALSVGGVCGGEDQEGGQAAHRGGGERDGEAAWQHALHLQGVLRLSEGVDRL